MHALLGAIRAQGGQPAFVRKTGTAVLNIVALVWRCPALAYGPGDSNLDHIPHERFPLAKYRRASPTVALTQWRPKCPPFCPQA